MLTLIPLRHANLVWSAWLFVVTTVTAVAGTDAFLRRPDIHGDQVVFTAEGDLWLGSVQTRAVRRLTSHPGLEIDAKFSPDGRQIAFSAEYDGGADIYVMAAEGGEPRRLTYEAFTGGDLSRPRVEAWSQDCKYIYFRSHRNNPEPCNRLFRIPAKGGIPEIVPIPTVEHATLNRDGRRFAYVPVTSESNNWYRYRGGQADDVWLADIQSHTFKRLTDHPGVDTTPIWLGSAIYFISERDGIANLYKLDPDSRKVTSASHFSDYECRYPSTDGNRIVFQHGNGIALFDPATGRAEDLKFELHSERIHARSRRTGAQPWVNHASIGPVGRRIVVEARGQILSVPVENGDYRHIATIPAAGSKYPAWSPDGKSIAFISDRTGEDQIWIAPASGDGEPRQVTRDHVGPLGRLAWSPDSKLLATIDHETKVLLVDAASGATTIVDQADRLGWYDRDPGTCRFSPDSRWLTYSRIEPNWNQVVYLYEIAGRRKTAVTLSAMDSYSPSFDPSGKYLVFLSDRQLDPANGGLSRFFSFDNTTRVSLVTLSNGIPSPFRPDIDDEGVPEPPKQSDKAVSGPIRIDIDGIEGRVVDVPLPPSRYQKVEALDGRLLVLDSTIDTNLIRYSLSLPVHQLISFDLKKKQSTTIIGRVVDFEVSADRKKVLLHTDVGYAVVDSTSGAVAGVTGKVDFGAITLDVDPASEWKQIFNESWRIARDFFYVPNMHGANWDAIKRKYQTMLPAVGDRTDLNVVLGEMISELSVGHAYVSGGDLDKTTRAPNVGYLGADYEPVPGAGAVRITRLLRSDGFDLTARSPLLEPGLGIKTGDYILAINAKQVRADADIQSLLVGTAGETISVRVNDRPTIEGSREVRVKPTAGESKSRYYDWVAGRREYVRMNGGDNIGYVHMPNMVADGLQEFTKAYYANNQIKDGMIYDVRNNTGGYISASLLLQMAVPIYTYFNSRVGASWTRQRFAFPGHSVALCNEFTLSNGEEFSDGFQRLKLGKLIGKRTWGGEVGSGGGYKLIDGGRIYIPNYGAWTPNGKWIIEGDGVRPDEEVEQDPVSVLAGRDPQLDKAIAYLKEQIAKLPVLRLVPPAPPVKALNDRK